MEEQSIKDFIIEELKKQGMDVAEDAAISMVKSVLNIIPQVVAKTENKYDDLLIPVLGVVEKPIMDLLDKIDGKEG